MDKRILDHDPFTGVTTYHYYDRETDETTIHQVADLEPLQRFRQELRKDEGATKQGIKEGNWLYATIHPIEQELFLKKYGFSVFQKGMEKEVYKVLNFDPDFQICKTTTGHHA